MSFRHTVTIAHLALCALSVTFTGRAAAQSAPAPIVAISGTAISGTVPEIVAQQYSIMIWESPAQLALRTDPSRGAAYWAAFASIGEELQKAGVLRGGTALRTGDAVRTVMVRDGAQRVRRAAHANAREELGGYFIIEVASLDEAVRWAGRIPSAVTGAIEVRPAYPAPTMMK
ncbi:MAG: YciI family protein [Gemmatimonadota bacterium]